MVQRALELTILSAKDLNKVTHIGKMDVYVIISISGGKSRQEVRTLVDKDGGTNPVWNFQTEFFVDETAAQQNIVFKVKCERALGDKDIGEVHIPVKELLQSPEAIDGKKQTVSYQVRKPDGKPKGFINLAYQFGERFKAEEKNTMVYPPPHGVGSSSPYPQSAPVYPPQGGYPLSGHSEGGYPPPPKHSEGGYYPPPYHPEAVYPPPKHLEGGYYPPSSHSEAVYPPPPKHSEGQYPPPPSQYHGAPPPQPSQYHGAPSQQGGYPHPPPQYTGHGYPQPPAYVGYPAPPPPGYGYPPPQPGYGYAPPKQKPPKKNSSSGLGLGAGLLGGALGGMLIGDMISDVIGDVDFDF